LVIHLICSAEEELRRIRARARPEEAAVQLDYLSRLNIKVAESFLALPAKCQKLEIHSEMVDFAHDDQGKIHVVSQIRSILGL
jgi:deoxyadenosine/deoxycytidine kinase